MKRNHRPVAAVVLLLALASCGGNDGRTAEPPETPIGTPVPTPTSTAAPKPLVADPGGNAPLLAKMKYRLQENTVRMAGAARQTSARCDKTEVAGTPGESVRCFVTYNRLEVPWTVTITSAGDFVTTYRTTPQKGIVVADGVRAAFYAAHSPTVDPGIKDLRCGDLPDAQLVELNTPTPYRCQYQSDRYKKGSRITLSVVSKETGPDFVLPR